MKVLILGARAPACLEWARAFHEYGAQVWVADSQLFPLSRFSKSVWQYLSLPEPKSFPYLWATHLKEFVARESIDLLIPTCEEVFYLSAAMEIVDFDCEVLTCHFSLLQELHHKGNFSSLVAGLSITTPETKILRTASDVTAFNKESFQWVFKPAFSRFAVQTRIKPSAHELLSIAPTNASPWVAQKYVAGKEYCSFSVLRDGKVLAHSCYHPAYRVGKGSGIYFEVADPQPILQFVTEFGRLTGYTGQVGFDFIEDANSQFFVLECNPRATSGIHLFDDQRRNLIVALLASSPSSVLTATKKPRMVGLAMLLFAMPKNITRKKFWTDFRAAKDVIATANDLGPLLGQVPGFVEISSRALFRKCNLLSAATTDIEWDGQTIFSAAGES